MLPCFTVSRMSNAWLASTACVFGTSTSDSCRKPRIVSLESPRDDVRRPTSLYHCCSFLCLMTGIWLSPGRSTVAFNSVLMSLSDPDGAAETVGADQLRSRPEWQQCSRRLFTNACTALQPSPRPMMTRFSQSASL